MRKRIGLVKTKCERCGKEVYTASRSAFGKQGDVLKKKWGIICEDCVTPDELHQIMQDQVAVIMKGA